MLPTKHPRSTPAARDENRLIRLSAEDQRRFVALLLNPPEPVPALRRARESYARLFGAS